jgi:PD-(D/E)XK nuclease superfamily protein
MRALRTTLPPYIHSKRRGELAEAAFLHKAAGLGLTVAKPWGDSNRFDFIVETGGRMVRVQVKSAYSGNKYGAYYIHVHGAKHTRVYTPSEVDLLAAYIAPMDTWYILPIEIFENRGSCQLLPNSLQGGSRYEKYREAWSLMTGPKEVMSED